MRPRRSVASYRALLSRLLVLAGLTALAAAPSVRAGEDLAGDPQPRMVDRTPGLRPPRAALGTASASFDPETIWVGYWSGANTANNWWKVGGVPGGNRPGVNDEGLWNFEAPQHVHGDSLSGWWMTRIQHQNFSGPTRTDENRPWWAVPYGNIVNFARNPGGGTDRTFGVTGMWHRDAGALAVQAFIPGLGGSYPVNPAWTPLGGGYSAWMGMRAYGDITYVDPITQNAYNGDTQTFLYGSGFYSGGLATYFPGYIGDMDQMLYRDVDMSGYTGAGVAVRFKWRTNMSTGKDTDPAFRTGWHEGDGLSQNQFTPGNFISAEAGVPANAAAPIDSLQLYIGAPVEGEWKTSIHPLDGDPDLVALGVINPVTGRRIIGDPLRRWFNEVLMKDARLRLFGAAGSHAPQTTTVSISHANVQAMLDSAAATGQAGRLRLVFRVHTNRAFDDASGGAAGAYNSGYSGAAVVDDVEINVGAGFTTIGDFESPGAIHNMADPLLAWHSTGKPPATYFHPHDVATLAYEDICGPVGSGDRGCNLSGVVISMGLHDYDEATSHPDPLSTEREGDWGFISPAINLAGADQTSKDPTKNNMNLSASERWATDDYYFYTELYTGALDVFTTGQFLYFNAQVYPQQQLGGAVGWSRLRSPGWQLFDPEKQCYGVAALGLFYDGLGATSNLSGYPDSLRFGFVKQSQCYRFGISTGCGSTDGLYVDQVAIAVVDGYQQPIAADLWDLFNDTFPANETPGLPGTAAFDTAAAHVKIGLNVAQRTFNLSRYLVPGDSLTVQTSGDSLRLDLLFRILPGVGNYQSVGNQASGLRRVPTNAAAGTVTPGDGTFFGSFMANPGALAGPPGSINPGAAAAAHSAAPSGWNETVWNSARMDTTETYGHAMFPVQANNVGQVPSGGQWCSNYHESELAARPTLGVPRNRCFIRDTTVFSATDPNITCGDPLKGPYPPAWVTNLPMSRTGWDGTTATVEGTKILPDGLLTPGAHVQYFVRRQDLGVPASAFTMVPDTNVVYPQFAEGQNEDGHRWQQFSVLPDRWKDPAFGRGGLAMACMLVIDNADRRGPERVWKAVADSIGLTSAGHRGRADGYGGAPSGADLNDAAYFISGRNGQPGTLWDLYQKKASESLWTGAQGIGGRLGYRLPGTLMDDGAGNGKWTYNPPTLEMLQAYYRMILVLTGDLNTLIWGPQSDQTSNDVGLLGAWLESGDAVSPDRGILVIGESFAEAANSQSGPQQSFVRNYLGTTFQQPSYRTWVPDPRKYVDIEVDDSVDGGAGDVYGVDNGCRLSNDVLQSNPLLPGTQANLHYVRPDQSLVPAGVLKGHTATYPWIAQTIGVDIEAMRGRFGANLGRLAWMYYLIANTTYGAVACYYPGPPVLDVPGVDRAVADYLSIQGNPVRGARATIQFGLVLDDDVEVRIFDVSGRLVRRLAERRFKAGEHTLVWDGADDGGRRLPRGVYFTRLVQKSGRFEAVKKVTLLQ